MFQFRASAVALLVTVMLAGCGDPTKEEILKKSEGADTKALLEKALGRPNDIKKIGPLESWTYKAADGAVNFVIAGDQVTISSTEDKPAR